MDDHNLIFLFVVFLFQAHRSVNARMRSEDFQRFAFNQGGKKKNQGFPLGILWYKNIMSDSLYQLLARFFIFYLPLLFSLCVHEWAHAWTAHLKGDNLARDEGRMSLNPFVHADLIGTCVLPLMSIFMGLPVFGWARPVPVNPAVLKNPKNDMFWIALAGPLSNFCLSLTGTALLASLYLLSGVLPFFYMGVLSAALEAFIYINLLLGFFNLLPLHPLDGGKVLARFLPVEWNWRLEQWENYTSLILIMLFVTGAFSYLVLPADWLSSQLIFLAKNIF